MSKSNNITLAPGDAIIRMNGIPVKELVSGQVNHEH